jgi:hypothetical protein
MSVRPGTLGTLPYEWPATGTLEGKPVDLATVESTLPYDRWGDVVVDVPGEGKRRPWRGVPLLGFDAEGKPTGPF